MKSIIYMAIIVIISTIITPKLFASYQGEMDSITMGDSYANDVYYSFENGEIMSVDRTNWDIAFNTSIMSAGIITNDGKGIELYLYPHADTSGWATIDTTGMSTWNVLYNSEESWEEGAFNNGSFGLFDYGWGVYSMITHNVEGDSLYLIKFPDESVKKIWIVRKKSIENTYVIRYANIDNSDDITLELNCSEFTDQNFAYFSFNNGELFPREPAKTSWDILFSRYMALQPNGAMYLVTGVFNNTNTYANKFSEVSQEFGDWASAPFDSTKTSIGFDWKYFDMNQFSWVIEDSLVFFVNTHSNDIYGLTFTDFTGTSAGGKIVFEKEMVSASSLSLKGDIKQDLAIYPNPGRGIIKVDIPQELVSDFKVRVYDISGQQIYNEEYPARSMFNHVSINTDSFVKGIYLVTLQGPEAEFKGTLIVP